MTAAPDAARPVRVLALSGSVRPDSSNTALVQALGPLASPGVSVEVYGSLAGLPHFDPGLDREGDPLPAAVASFRARLRDADAVVISTPEYAYGMPGVLKNALDWTVSSGAFAGKPTGAISASPNHLGGERAHASLVLTLTALAARVVEDASFTVPFVRTKLNAEGAPETNLAAALRAALDALARATREC